MATVIDELVVALSLDPAKFTAGQKAALAAFKRTQEESLKIAKEIEYHGRRIDDFIGGMKRGIVSALGAFFVGGGIKEVVQHIANLDAATGRASRTIGISVEKLSTWQGVARQFGLSAEGITGALAGVGTELQQLSLGVGGFDTLAILSQLHINPYGVKDVGDLFTKIHDAVQGMDPARAAAFLRLMPGMNEDAIKLLTSSNAEFKKLFDTMVKIGPAAAQDAKDAQAFQKELADLELTAERITRQTGIVPFFAEQLGKLQELMTTTPWGRAGMSFWDWILTPPSFTILQGGRADQILKTLREFKLPEGGYHPFGLGAAEPKSGGAGTRGDRNNNPGNIEYGPFAVAHGATGSDGRFAIFPSKADGERAMEELLGGKSYRGLTLSQIANKYSPGAPPGYLQSMSAATGLGPNAVPNLDDPAVRALLMNGMTRGEGTHLGAAAAAGANAGRGGTSNRSSTVINGNVIVNTQETHAAGIARDIKREIERGASISGANFGQQG